MKTCGLCVGGGEGGGGEGASSTDQQKGLKKHNEYRRIHSAPDMKLDSSMSEAATRYAQELLRKGSLQHSETNDGENLAMRCSRNGLSPEDAVKMW